jgi:L-gulonate 3-dehydrogenase
VNNSVACVGAGVVGRSWALAFARAGCAVTLFDVSAAATEAAVSWLSERRFVVRVASTLGDAVEQAAFVQESIAENLDAKRALFADLDLCAQAEALLASSTSAFPASALFAGLRGAARCIVAHPVNPPHLVPLVELAPSSAMSEATVARAAAFLRSVGQTPIRLMRESPGFVVNRLQMALLAEALDLLATGVASVDDIDLAVRQGLARRWVLTGPFETAHLNADGGAREYFGKFGAAMNQLIASLNKRAALDPELIEVIHTGATRSGGGRNVAQRQADRDDALTGLNMFLASVEQIKAQLETNQRGESDVER